MFGVGFLQSYVLEVAGVVGLWAFEGFEGFGFWVWFS